MFPIPGFDSPFDFVGVFLLIMGVLLTLAGFSIITPEKWKITPGKRTWRVGAICLVLGLVFLIIEPVFQPGTDPANGSSPASTADLSEFEAVSSNEYELIPLQNERSDLFDGDDPNKNLSLRKAEFVEDYELSLIDSTGQVDLEAPQLSYVFEAEFVSAYSLLDDNGQRQQAFPEAMGIRTSPGDEITIPQRDPTIYQGKYLATVLYADDNSLSFIYMRKDSTEAGYIVYYEEIEVDPNLLEQYRKSQGGFLPGLVADVPVGRAIGHEIIVALRHNNEFKDIRLQRDWWQGLGG